jgi:preprotein translocase subunit SecG
MFSKFFPNAEEMSAYTFKKIQSDSDDDDQCDVIPKRKPTGLKAKRRKCCFRIFVKQENFLKRWAIRLSYLFETITIFLGAAVDEKTAAQKQKKSPIFGYPLSFFLNISQSQTTKARRLRFLPIDLAKNFEQNQSIFFLFLQPPATISAVSKTPKTISLSGESLVKSSPLRSL